MPREGCLKLKSDVQTSFFKTFLSLGHSQKPDENYTKLQADVEKKGFVQKE